MTIDVSNNGYLAGWTHAVNTSTFTCPATGTYIVTYNAALQNTTTATNTFVGFLAYDVTSATTIPGSQAIVSSFPDATSNAMSAISVTFMYMFNAGDQLEIQWIASTAGVNLVPSTEFSSVSPGTQAQSFNITIQRVD